MKLKTIALIDTRSEVPGETLGGKANGRFDAGMRDESDDDELMDTVLLELKI